MAVDQSIYSVTENTAIGSKPPSTLFLIALETPFQSLLLGYFTFAKSVTKYCRTVMFMTVGPPFGSRRPLAKLLLSARFVTSRPA